LPYSLLSLFQLLNIELEFFSFQDVSISTAWLTGSWGDASQHSTGIELFSNMKVDDSASLLSLDGSLYVSWSLLGFSGNGCSGSTCSISGGSSWVNLGDLLFTELDIIVLIVVLSEGSGINVHNSVLDNGLSSDQFVVSGVVNHVQKSGSLGDLFRSPTEVAGVKFQSSVLVVGSSSSHWSYLLGSEFGVGRGSCHLELSLLLMDWHSSTGCSSFVAWVSWDTHFLLINNNLTILTIFKI
jgi:hypothetical protein